MKAFVSSLLALLLAATMADARSWADTQGRMIEAEVVKVNPDRTVVLRTDRGKVVTVPFDTFSDMDVEHLDYLLSRRGRGKPHPVPWYELNDLFGMEIWQDDLLWDDPTAAAGERMKMKKESKTDFMENHRAYPLGKEKILGEPVYTTALYGGTEHVESLSLIFLNRGDILELNGRRRTPSAEQIEASGMRVHYALVPKLGEPKRDSLGKGDLREKVWRWDWNGHAIMLSLQEGKYAVVRIMPSDRADRSGRVEKLTEAGLKRRMASCVERRDNGDVVIRNIPMVNQGPKGYCSPATWERYLRYMGIPADMYLLALAANTGVGGGTYSYQMIDATRSLVSANGRELKDIDSSLKPEDIAEYIDQGLPIMWHLISDPDFRKAIHDNSAQRNGEEPEERDFCKDSGGHICLIIGYNEQTGEIATSDSYGPEFAERWVEFHEARRASRGSMNVIKW
ncbi:MAG: C39 family peptidase [Verrucomicrobiota bacterium]